MDVEEQAPVDETPDPAEPEEPQAKFTQDDVDRIVSERLKREERKAEKAKEEAERQAREKALKDQEDWKRLAEERTETISEREKRISELESIETERDSANERITSLEKRLQGIIKPRLESVPELYRPFVEGMTVEEQAEWLEKNGEKLETDTQKPSGSLAVGRGQKNGGADTEQAKNARESQRFVSRI